MPRSLPVTSYRQVQGQILLERALFCVGCEVIFSGTTHCPRCSGETVWPLAEWLPSTRLSPAASAQHLRAAADAPAPQGEQTRPAA
jgi:hypothetical protein